MPDKAKRAFPVKYAVACLAGLALGGLIAWGRGLSPSLPLNENARLLSDGFFVMGFAMAAMGALVLISTATDFFDIFTYGFKSLIVLFTALVKPREHISFYDYKAARREKRGQKSWFLLCAGLTLIALSLVCLCVYYA